MKRTTIKERVMLALWPYHVLTATELARVTDTKLSSMSSALKRMADAGELYRYECFGPKGGYGYARRNA